MNEKRKERRIKKTRAKYEHEMLFRSFHQRGLVYPDYPDYPDYHDLLDTLIYQCRSWMVPFWLAPQPYD